MKLNILHIACIVAIFQALLMAVVFLTSKKGNKQSNVILGFWFLCFAVLISYQSVLSYGVWQYISNYYKPIFVVSQLFLLIGPLFYFYTRSLLDDKFHFGKKDLIHLLPMIIITCYIMFKFIFVRDFILWDSFLAPFCNGFFLVQNLFYYFLILRLLKLHGFSIKTLFSDKRDLKYNWLRFLIIGSFVIWVVELQYFLCEFIQNRQNLVKWCSWSAPAYFLVAFLFVTSIVYVALKIPHLFLSKKKYMKSSLSKKDKVKFENQLLKYMNDEKIYLDPNLSLDILTNKLSITREHLSQIINETFHLNFYDFINQYRVNECINCLKDKNNYEKTLLRIAFECGFNTKATFNSAFKKFTGMTPKEFRKGHNLNKNFNIK